MEEWNSNFVCFPSCWLIHGSSDKWVATCRHPFTFLAARLRLRGSCGKGNEMIAGKKAGRSSCLLLHKSMFYLSVSHFPKKFGIISPSLPVLPVNLFLISFILLLLRKRLTNILLLVFILIYIHHIERWTLWNRTELEKQSESATQIYYFCIFNCVPSVRAVSWLWGSFMLVRSNRKWLVIFF